MPRHAHICTCTHTCTYAYKQALIINENVKLKNILRKPISPPKLHGHHAVFIQHFDTLGAHQDSGGLPPRLGAFQPLPNTQAKSNLSTDALPLVRSHDQVGDHEENVLPLRSQTEFEESPPGLSGRVSQVRVDLCTGLGTMGTTKLVIIVHLSDEPTLFKWISFGG